MLFLTRFATLPLWVVELRIEPLLLDLLLLGRLVQNNNIWKPMQME